MAKRNRRRTLAFQYGSQNAQTGAQNSGQAAALGGAQEASRFYETASELGNQQQGASAYQASRGAGWRSAARYETAGQGQAARGGTGAGQPNAFETAAAPGTTGGSYQQAAQVGPTEAERFYKTQQNLKKPQASQ